MEIETQAVDKVGILVLNGRFDAQYSGEVRKTIRNTMQFYTRMVVDLEEVTFMDSAALATLVQGMKQCREAGGDLRVCSLQQPVRTIFELTRLDKAFTLFPDRTTAVQSFNA
jgi:anti-sigma B factor antagonist